MKRGERQRSGGQTERFGAQLKELRRWLRQSQSALAAAAGVSQPDVSKLERGIADLPARKRHRLIDAVVDAIRAREGDETADMTRDALRRLAGLTPVPMPLLADDPRAGQDFPQLAPHAAMADACAARGAWQQAEYHYLMAAQEADGVDPPRWAEYTARAGLMAMCLSQFERAERLINQAVAKSEDEIGTAALAQGHVFLGWTRFEQGKHPAAERALREGRRLAGRATACSSDEAAEMIEGALHFSGRNAVDWGISAGEADLVRSGLRWLRRAYALTAQRQATSSMAYNALRQVPGVLQIEPGWKEAERLLDESKDKLGSWGTAVGHYHLHKGLLLREQGKFGLARHQLEQAREGYLEPVFYPIGAARAHRALGLLRLQCGDLRAHEAQQALAYALTATVLHPYEPNLDALRQAAGACRQLLGGPEFAGYWRELVDEQIERQDVEPFTDLRRLPLIASGEAAIQQLAHGKQRAEQAVRGGIVL